MNYYLLKSLLGSGKTPLTLSQPSPSFLIAGEVPKAYIEPTFEKIVFETERPTIILVSAVGATGKTALALQLSRELRLPLLDLAKHKPVGDNTLTGLLTSAFDVGNITNVFSGLASGKYGVIIDGVDEGRSKTTEKAFEAFLDDIARLCRPESSATFLLLGRTQILDACWDYLTAMGVPVALITISAFTIQKAREYIDTFTTGPKGSATYSHSRDAILEKLSKAFAGTSKGQTDDFLSFIGYPPVLDAIVTLLSEEQNYHRLLQDLEAPEGQNVEISLLKRIAQYVLDRERSLKVIPNILEPLLENAPAELRLRALVDVFSPEEQSVRLVAYCIGRQVSLGRFREPVLDEQYEARLATWLPEHPFLKGREFRNAVFESLALAMLIASRTPENLRLLEDYARSHKPSYHLIYMLDIISVDRRVPLSAISSIFTAAMEFRSVRSLVELRIDGPEWSEDSDPGSAGEIDIEIRISLSDESQEPLKFEFSAEIEPGSCLDLGSRLAGAFVSVPCDVLLHGTQELELTAPVFISGRTMSLTAKTLILRTNHQAKDAEADVVIDAARLETSVESIVTSGVPLALALKELAGVSYPVIQYVQKYSRLPADPLLQQKYFRLKRILMEFRSHSKGSLARYRYKIEHERVLKNEVGRAVLDRLLKDEVLVLRGKFFHLDTEKLSVNLGVSWQDLRRGAIPDLLEKYIKSIA